jgi:putative nucleotidyltransferase with HDIG domain
MGSFPARAKQYIWTIVILGWLAFACVIFTQTAIWKQWEFLLLGGILATIASNLKVPVVGFRRWPGYKSDNNSSMSLGFVPTFFVLLTLGPAAGMIVGAITALLPTCFPRRSHYYQILFSVAALLLSVWTAGMVLAPTGLAVPDGNMHHFARHEDGPLVLLAQSGALVVATLVYFVTNTVLIAAAISLTSGGKNPYQMWRDHFLWTLPGYLAGASCATIANFLLDRIQPDLPSLIAAVVVAVPIPLLIHMVYRYHREKDDANLRYIQELEQKQGELERANAELERSQTELQDLYTATVESFALAIDAKDAYTKQHISRVKDYAVALAHELGMRDTALRAIEYGALLHDIGKIAIPEAILNKAGKLTDEEFEVIKEHPVKGVEILEPVRFPFPVLDVVRSHHERWDGKGYPDALEGREIPIGGRILAVADVFDALTSDRSYRAGWSHERAIEYLMANRNTHFDPEVVDAFLSVLKRLQQQEGVGEGSGRPAVTAESLPSELREAVADGIDRVSQDRMATSLNGSRNGYHKAANAAESGNGLASKDGEIAESPCARTPSSVE